MLEKYLRMEVSGIQVYMFHENIRMLKPYIESDDRIHSYAELLDYCRAHKIRIEFQPPQKGSKREYRKMRRLLEKYPEVIMSKKEVADLMGAVATQS
jgi:hypothetical protein